MRWSTSKPVAAIAGKRRLPHTLAGREVDKWLGGRLKRTVIEDAAQLKVSWMRQEGTGDVQPTLCMF